jgi:hypothetical protein
MSRTMTMSAPLIRTVKALSITPNPSHLPSNTSQRRRGLETMVWIVPEAISPAMVSTEVATAISTTMKLMT